MKKKGVTLVELIVVIAIMSIIAGFIYSINANGQKVYMLGTRKTQLQNSARVSINTLTQSINTAAKVYTITNIVYNAASNTASVNGTTFNNVYDEDNVILYVQPREGIIHYLYFIRDNKLYKKASNGAADELIASNIDDYTEIDAPLNNQQNKTFRIKISTTYGGERASYITYASLDL